MSVSRPQHFAIVFLWTRWVKWIQSDYPDRRCHTCRCQPMDAERPRGSTHEVPSRPSHLSDNASSSSLPEEWCSFPDTVKLKAKTPGSKHYPTDSSILVWLDLHPAAKAAEDWAPNWCNTLSTNILDMAPCCYDNTTQCIWECWWTLCTCWGKFFSFLLHLYIAWHSFLFFLETVDLQMRFTVF